MTRPIRWLLRSLCAHENLEISVQHGKGANDERLMNLRLRCVRCTWSFAAGNLVMGVQLGVVGQLREGVARPTSEDPPVGGLAN